MQNQGRRGKAGRRAASDAVPLRGSHGPSERERDLDLLAWTGRFRFVTAEAAAEAFGVSVQRMRARVARLCDAGLLVAHRTHVSEARVLYLSRHGALAIGFRPRKPPRPDAHRVHELAIIALVTALETRFAKVLTERECRQAERVGGQRYSVDVFAGGRRQRRWPDAVLLDGERRIAFEIEFAAKPSSRLSAIVDGYLRGGFDAVRFLVASPALAGRLARIVHRRSAATVPTRFKARPRVAVGPWLDVRADEAAAIRAAVLLAGDQARVVSDSSSELAS
jgi:hypothetical protein